MIVAVGSMNPVKLTATTEAFKIIFGEARVVGVRVATSVGPQPVGLSSTLLGALERAEQAIGRGMAEYGVGIEAGLVEFPGTATGYMDLQICVVVDREGYCSVGVGPGFELPPIVVEKVLRGGAREVEEAMVGLTGIENIGDRMGAVGWLSRDAVDRRELVRYAVLMALIPRIRGELYRLRLRRMEDVIGELRRSR